jgi:putative colanic acid biosynthesis UDP-glucose lipid carrier transferase
MPMSSDNPSTTLLEPSPAWVPPRGRVSAISSAPLDQKNVQFDSVDPAYMALLKRWYNPAVVVATLFICVPLSHQETTANYWALALAALLISYWIFSPLRLLTVSADKRSPLSFSRVLLEWAAVVGLLLCFGFSFKIADAFPRNVILSWFALTPINILLADYCAARAAARTSVARRRHIIIGANDVGVELARRISQSGSKGTFLGYFDFRNPDRLPEHARQQLVGTCKQAVTFVCRNAVDAIYIALPISNAPRIEDLLQEFRDTTASVYFVPNIFAFELVQARCIEINGMPLLSICDTPFYGMNAVKKRALDIAVASIALLLTAPVMIAAAIAVRLSSPGPVVFKQRRYGLNGEEIEIYKFRSMTVCEDGQEIQQATKEDHRFTRVGRFLRRTSMDELPQLFNVFEGRMSLVGPRPHALAHNETYRRLISGYMIRHKVRPGMTGSAQVNGLRGETPTLEQMRLRVQHDIEYLRHWSLWLDVRILLKTALIVVRGRNAH